MRKAILVEQSISVANTCLVTAGCAAHGNSLEDPKGRFELKLRKAACSPIFAKVMHKNVAMCHFIAEVIAADGVLDERERAYLENTMEDYGLSDDERQQVRDFQNTGADQAAKSLGDADKAKLRDDLLAATLIDGHVSNLETEKVQRITALLGLESSIPAR